MYYFFPIYLYVCVYLSRCLCLSISVFVSIYVRSRSCLFWFFTLCISFLLLLRYVSISLCLIIHPIWFSAYPLYIRLPTWYVAFILFYCFFSNMLFSVTILVYFWKSLATNSLTKVNKKFGNLLGSFGEHHFWSKNFVLATFWPTFALYWLLFIPASGRTGNFSNRPRHLF